MKKTTKIFGLLLTLFGLALVTGCTPITETPDVPEEKNYTVSYSTEHGTAPEAITVKENTVLESDQLKALEAEGFTFTGWFDEDDIKVEVGYKVTKNVTLTAKWSEVTYSITISSGIKHGSISIQGNKTTAVKGETITLTVTPDEGYELATLTVTQGTTSVTVTGNTFTMPASNVTVGATFSLIPTEPEPENPPVVEEPEEPSNDDNTDDSVDDEPSSDSIPSGTEVIIIIDADNIRIAIKNKLKTYDSYFVEDSESRIWTSCLLTLNDDIFNNIKFYSPAYNTFNREVVDPNNDWELKIFSYDNGQLVLSYE